MNNEKSEERLKRLRETYVPSIFIGIGGSGSTIVQSIRQKAEKKFYRREDKYEIIDKIFQFIAIDSMGRSAQEIGIPDGNFTSMGNFNGTEVVKTKLGEKDKKERDEEFAKWWYSGFYPGNIKDGAGGIRINGRLCLFQNLAGTPNIRHTIERACQYASLIFQDKIERGERSSINIYFFNSIAGGTGSGIFMDLAFYLRRRLSAQFIPNIFCFLITPEVIRLKAHELDDIWLKANAYATLCELDFWQNPFRGQLYNLTISDELIESEERELAFDLVHIISTVTEKGRTINDFDIVHKLIADIVFHEAIQEESGYRIAEPRSNVLDTYQQQPLLDNRYPVTYGSATIIMLRCPIAKIAKFIAMHLVSEVIRDNILGEPEEEARITFQTFIEKKSPLSPESLERKIKQDTSFPSIKTVKSQISRKIMESKKGDIEAKVREAKQELDKCIHAIELFFKGTRGEEGYHGKLTQGLKRSLRDELDRILNRPEPKRVGLINQFTDKLKNYLEGRISTEEGHEYNLRDKIDELKKNKKQTEENVEETLSKIKKGFKFKAGRSSIDKFLSKLSDLRTELLIYEEEIIAFYESSLDHVKELREGGIKFIRDVALHSIMDKCEKEPDNIWAKEEYDPERGGIVVDVLGKSWADKRLERLRRERGGKQYIDLSDNVLSHINSLASQKMKEMWDAMEAGKSVDEIKREAGELKRDSYKQVMEKAEALIREHFEDLTLWRALEEESGLGDEEKINEALHRRITELVNKVAPWWPVDDQTLRTHGLYTKQLIREMNLLIYNEDEYRKFKTKYPSIDLIMIIANRIGQFTEILSDDKYSLLIIHYKYGAPLHLFYNMDEYLEAYLKRGQYFPQTPLHIDYRYISDPSYSLPHLTEDKESISKIDNIRHGEYPKKVLFCVAEYLDIPVEEIGMKPPKAGRFITRTRKGRMYVIDDGTHAILHRLGREYAEEEFFGDSWKEVYETIYNKISKYWNNKLSSAQQKENLEKVKSQLEEEIRRRETKTKAGQALRRQLIEVFKQDLKAVEWKLESGNYSL